MDLHLPKNPENSENPTPMFDTNNPFADIAASLDIIAQYFIRKGLKEGLFSPDDYSMDSDNPDPESYHGE